MRIKSIRVAASLCVICMCVSCSTETGLRRAYMRSGPITVRQLKSTEKRTEGGKETSHAIKVRNTTGQELTLLRSGKDERTGENIAEMTLDEVEVIAMSKTVPERNGKLGIAFVVNVPGDYVRDNWNINVRPILDNEGKKMELEAVSVSGEDYASIQNRKRAKMERKWASQIKRETALLQRRKGFYPYYYRNDSTVIRKEKAYNEWKEDGKKEQEKLRVDTVLAQGQRFRYYYTQEFPSEEICKHLKLSCSIELRNMNGKKFLMEGTDTLTYIVSSMTQFLDRTPRYIRETIYRKETEKISTYIYFPAGSTEVVDTLGNNREEIDRVKDKLREIMEKDEYVLDSVSLSAACSPEGSYALNAQLAEGRAHALESYMTPLLADYIDHEQVKSYATPENWERLKELVEKDNWIGDATAVLELMEQEKDPDERERKIAGTLPKEYAYMKRELYPKLRTVDFVFHLSRKGMVEDVMYTDVIDKEYAKAIELMDGRRYKEAMPKLLEYRDMNTAICYMSLGYNGTAVNILLEQPETATREYLLAILYQRLKMDDLAKDIYLKACGMDEGMIERGQLDPEITELIRKYDLNKELYK